MIRITFKPPYVLCFICLTMYCTFVFQGGDADANAAVAGALLGCKLGLDAIPRSWTEPLLHRAWLDDLLDR